jgi:hypothetical protein
MGHIVRKEGRKEGERKQKREKRKHKRNGIYWERHYHIIIKCEKIRFCGINEYKDKNTSHGIV